MNLVSLISNQCDLRFPGNRSQSRTAGRCASQADYQPHSDWQMGELDDLMGTAIFLASKTSDYINGWHINIDGGFDHYKLECLFIPTEGCLYYLRRQTCLTSKVICV